VLREMLPFTTMRATESVRSELLQAQRRWAIVNQVDHEAARQATLEEKLDALERLMQSVDDFGWRHALDDDAIVRERWSRLRAKLGSIDSRTTTR